MKHSIEVSLSPSWLGREEMRAAGFVGEQLVLTTDSRLARDGRMFRVEVTWKGQDENVNKTARVRANVSRLADGKALSGELQEIGGWIEI